MKVETGERLGKTLVQLPRAINRILVIELHQHSAHRTAYHLPHPTHHQATSIQMQIKGLAAAAMMRLFRPPGAVLDPHCDSEFGYQSRYGLCMSSMPVQP